MAGTTASVFELPGLFSSWFFTSLPLVWGRKKVVFLGHVAETRN